jgi:hypothetical protein
MDQLRGPTDPAASLSFTKNRCAFALWQLLSRSVFAPACAPRAKGPGRTPIRRYLALVVRAAHPHADCPRWREFLNVATGGDAEFARFLRCAAGCYVVALRRA